MGVRDSSAQVLEALQMLNHDQQHSVREGNTCSMFFQSVALNNNLSNHDSIQRAGGLSYARRLDMIIEFHPPMFFPVKYVSQHEDNTLQ